MRIAVATLGALLAAAVPDGASAQDYPWCADMGKDIGATSCSFTTLEQCRATVSGVGGFCMQNPSYRAPFPSRPARKLLVR